MIDDDNDISKKIAGYLDTSVADMKPGTVYRLQAARRDALARLAERALVADAALAGASAGASTVRSLGGRRSVWTSGRLWFGVLLIVAAVFGYHQWEGYRQLSELEETDAALLSSDLPIDAYLDRGFQNWLHLVGDD